MAKYKYFKSKNYRTNVNLVTESDIVEVSDQTSEGGVPTLQEVTEGENKNLINGNNFQGTQAGESTSPLSVTHSNMFGEQAGRTSTGDHVNLFGQEAGISQEGGQVNALGWGAAGTNTGSHVNAFGQASLYGNTGRHANAFGEEGGNFNNFKNVNLFGFQAEADQDNQTVFSKWVSGVTKFLSRLSYNNITADRKYELLDESGDLPITTSKDANFTAVNSVLYTAIATLTVTDPTPVEGQGYIVFVRNGTTTIDDVGYTSGNLIYRFYQGGAWSSTVFGSGGGGAVDLDDNLFGIKNNWIGLFKITATASTTTISTTANNTNNRVIFLPFTVQKDCIIEDVAFLLNAANDGASSTVNIYIHDDSNDGLPGVRLYNTESDTGITNTAQQEKIFTAVNYSLARGNYWIGIHFRGLNTAGANPTFVGGAMSLNSVFGTTLAYTNNVNRVLQIVSETGVVGNNPTTTILASTGINFPQIFVKL
jgi:hypothetical protein